MREYRLKLTTLLVASLFAVAGPAFGTCVIEGPYSVVGCAGLGPDQPAFFAPEPYGAQPPTVPPAAGQVIATWWQLGFGNELIDDPAGGEGDPTGGGWYLSPQGPEHDLFIGNDKGAGNASLPGGLDLRDAQPFGAPAGSTCFGAAANWGAAGIDGCCDNNRAYNYVGGQGDLSDRQLNPYYSAPPAPYAYTQIMDAPMGFLLREPTGRAFAAAFIRNKPRNGNPADPSSGQWDLNGIINGDPNPLQGGAPNVVPWQPIPRADGSLAFVDPQDPVNSPLILTMNWISIRLVHDGSVLPADDLACEPSCPSLYYNPLGYDNYGNPITGMGVLDQPQLATYFVDARAEDASGNCNTPWARLAGPIPHTADQVVHGISGLVIDNDNCGIRLCTHLGRLPARPFTPPVDASDRRVKQHDSQRGMFGDIGYDLCTSGFIVGGVLVSQRANLIAIEPARNAIRVRFETTVEVDITAIDVVGFDHRGERRLLATVEPQQGSTGVGARYEVDLRRRVFRDTRHVQIVLQPSGEGSNMMALR